jgi:hypothetical protein
MTKPAGTPRKKPEPRRRKLEARRSDAHNHERLTSLALSPPTLRNDVVNSWPTPPASASISKPTQASPNPAQNFYLGSTSYAAVFRDEHPLPDSLHEQPAERLSVTPSTSDRNVLGTRHCQMGVGHSIVARMRPFTFFERVVQKYFQVQKASALVGPLILSALPQLRDDLEQLTAVGSDTYAMYAELTKNTARPLRVPSTMQPSEFHSLFTGKNLRWETLGLIMSVAGFHAQFTSPNDPMFVLDDGTTLDRDTVIEDIVHATNDCIALCQAHGAVNDIMVWLIYSNMLVISNFYGDNCLSLSPVVSPSTNYSQTTEHGDAWATVSQHYMQPVCTVREKPGTVSLYFSENRDGESTPRYTDPTRPWLSFSAARL